MATQGKMIGIVAWSLAGILAIGLVVVALMGQQQAGRAADLGDALAQVAQTAGVSEWTPAAPEVVAVEGEEAPEAIVPEPQPVTAAALKDAAVRAGVLEQVQAAIQSVQRDLTVAQDALTASQAESSSARAEAAALTQRVQENAAQSESLSKELAARSEALAEAQAEAAQAVEGAEAAAQAAEKQKARLEKTVERLKAEKAKDVARLEAEIEVLRTPPEPVEEELAEESDVEEAPEEPEVELEAGRFIGSSGMFSLIHYGEEQTLRFDLLDGQTLTYEDVPPHVVARLGSAEDRLDMLYRFHVQGEYKSIPPDSVVVRKYWKWHRRHKARSEVRLVEPEAPVVEEEAVVSEDAVPEDTAAE